MESLGVIPEDRADTLQEVTTPAVDITKTGEDKVEVMAMPHIHPEVACQTAGLVESAVDMESLLITRKVVSMEALPGVEAQIRWATTETSSTVGSNRSTPLLAHNYSSVRIFQLEMYRHDSLLVKI